MAEILGANGNTISFSLQILYDHDKRLKDLTEQCANSGNSFGEPNGVPGEVQTAIAKLESEIASIKTSIGTPNARV